MIVVTGATGRLGRCVVDLLCKKVPATEIAVCVRDPKHERMLVAFGVPPATASIVADSDEAVRRGELDDSSGELGKLIGQPMVPLADAAAEARTRARLVHCRA